MSAMVIENLELGGALPWSPASRARAARGPGLVGAAGDDRPVRLHLTNRGRWTLAVIATVLAVGSGITGGQAVAGGPEQALEVVSYTVQPGDTLWRLAAAHAARGEDVRDVIVELQQLNGLPRADLTAGQVLILPVGR